MFVYQDWACGLLLLKVFYRIANSEGNLPGGLVIWRERFQHVQRIGVTKVPFVTAFTKVLWPMIKPLSYLLAIPYAITRGFIPLLNLTTEEMQSLYVFGFTVEYVLIVCYLGLKHVHKAVRRLHNSIRDDRYLVGRQLNNFLNAHM